MSEPQAGQTPRAVVLLSGGLDSATACAWALAEGYACHALAFDYGQRHHVELRASAAVAEALGCASHRVVRVDLAALGGSALVDAHAEVPTERDAQAMAAGIPATYVPARNTVFLSIGLAAAEALGASVVVLGINALDFSGYPDCRPEYLAAMQEVARLGTKVGVEGDPIRLLAPLVELTKADIVTQGTTLGVPWALTHSCYDPPRDEEATHCGRCDACLLRRRGFEAASIADPTAYRVHVR